MRKRNIPIKTFLLGFSILTLIWSLYFFASILPRLKYPFALDICEPFSLNRGLTLAKGQAIYKNIETFPFFLANYPPFYEGFLQFFLDQSHPSYFPGRLVAFLSQILLHLWIFGILYFLTKKKSIAFLGAFLPLFSASFWIWSGLHRVDFTGLCWNFLGIFVFLKSRDWKRWLSLLFFIIAGYTKQVFLVAPLSCALYLYFWENRKLALLYLLIYITLGGLVFTWLNFSTRGYFAHHTLLYNFTPYSFSQMVDLSLRPLGKMLGFLLLWVIFLFPYRKEYVQKPFVPFFLIYSAMAYLFLVITSGKSGASWNYFLEWISLFSILFALGMDTLLDHKKEIPLLWILILSLQLGYSFFALPAKNHTIWEKAKWQEPAKKDLLQFLKSHPKIHYVLVHNTHWKPKIPASDAVVLSGRPICLNIHYYLMKMGKLWHKSSLDREIMIQRFDLVILDTSTPPFPFDLYYAYWKESGLFYYYLPKRRNYHKD